MESLDTNTLITLLAIVFGLSNLLRSFLASRHIVKLEKKLEEYRTFAKEAN